MKRTLLLMCLALSALATSCSSDDTTIVSRSKKGSLSVNVAIAQSDVVWKSDDVIAVNGETSTAVDKQFVDKAGATFYVNNISAPYSIVYPASAYVDEARVQFPDNQYYVADGYDRRAAIMLGYAAKADTTAKMQCQYGLVKVFISKSADAATLKSVTLTAIGGEYVSGLFKTDYAAGTMTPQDKQYNSVTLLCGDEGVALSDTPTAFTFVVPVGTYINGFEVTAQDTNRHEWSEDLAAAGVTVERLQTAEIGSMTFNIMPLADVDFTITAKGYNWQIGDKIAVNTAASDALAAENITAPSVAVVSMKQVAAPYKLFYPLDLYTGTDRVRISNEQAYVAGSFDHSVNPMYGYSTGSAAVEMQNLCGYIQIPIINGFVEEKVAYIEVVANNAAEAICGKYSLSYKRGTYKPTDGKNTLKLVCATPVTLSDESATLFTVVVPAGTYTKGFTFNIYDMDGARLEVKAFESGVTIAQGQTVSLDQVTYQIAQPIKAITTATELQGFIEAANRGKISGYLADSGEVVLGNDIDLTGFTLGTITGKIDATTGLPVGFVGTFNGQGHKLMNWTSSSALFSNLAAGSTVKNVIIDSSCTLTYPNVNTIGANTNFGFLVSENYGTVDTCTNNANISLDMSTETTNYQLRAGALIGYTYLGGQVLTCTNTGNITMAFGGYTSNSHYFGTIQGSMIADNPETASQTTVMQGCINRGNLTITVAGTAAQNSYVGGISASANSFSQIKDCHNYGNVLYTVNAASAQITMGGVVAYSAGPISDSSNEGAVTLTSPSSVLTMAIGGISGYQNGVVTTCENKGAVGANVLASTDSAKIGSISGVYPCIGGICGVSYTGSVLKFSITNSNNSGAVSYKLGDIVTSKGGRHGIAGIVGAPYGPITGCTNTGAINVVTASADGTADSASSVMICCGGIAGCDYYGQSKTAGDSVSNLVNCINKGDITADISMTKSNQTLGGIVGWPGVEGTTLLAYCTKCTNEGTIHLLGAGKVRTGGIQGGTGHMDGCINKGKIIADTKVASSTAIGGLAGFHSQNHVAKDCESLGDITSLSTDATLMIGGLFGNIGNVALGFEGLKEKCNVTGTAENVYTAQMVGKFSGNAKLITFGTTANPSKVAGTLTRGTTATTLTAEMFLPANVSTLFNLLFSPSDSYIGDTAYHDISNVQFNE